LECETGTKHALCERGARPNPEFAKVLPVGNASNKTQPNSPTAPSALPGSYFLVPA